MRTRYAFPVIVALSATLMGAVADCSGEPDDKSPVISTTTPLPPAPKVVPSSPVDPHRVWSIECKVARVVDGDTLHADCEGRYGRITIRVIGIDTPETVAPGKEVECYGPEASREAKRQMPAGRKIRLTGDETQAAQDRYGRTLAYVSIYGTDYGLSMVRHGFADEYTYGKPYLKRSEYRRAQTKARALQLGKWGVCGS